MITQDIWFDSNSEVGWFSKIKNWLKRWNLGLNLLFHENLFLHEISNEKFADKSSPRARAGQACSNWLDIQRLKAVMMDCLLAIIHWNYRPNKEEQDWGVRLTIEADENLVVIDFIDGWSLFTSSNGNALSVPQGRTEGHRWVKDAIPINRAVICLYNSVGRVVAF